MVISDTLVFLSYAVHYPLLHHPVENVSIYYLWIGLEFTLVLPEISLITLSFTLGASPVPCSNLNTVQMVSALPFSSLRVVEGCALLSHHFLVRLIGLRGAPIYPAMPCDTDETV